MTLQLLFANLIVLGIHVFTKYTLEQVYAFLAFNLVMALLFKVVRIRYRGGENESRSENRED